MSELASISSDAGSSSGTSTHDIVTFLDEEASLSAVNMVRRKALLFGGSVEGRDHTIDSVLGRPISILDFSWRDSDNSATIVASEVLLEAYFAAHNNATTKIAGFGFLRADAKLKVVANAPPTAYGMMLISVIPQVAWRPSSADLTLSYLSGFPHVFLDLGTSHTAEIDVPYVNHQIWSNVDALFQHGFGSSQALQLFDHALVVLTVVSPLDSVTSIVPVSVFASLENVSVKEPIPVRAMAPRPLPPSRREAKREKQAAEMKAFSKSVVTTVGVAKDVAGAAQHVSGVIAGGLGASVNPSIIPPLKVWESGNAGATASVAGPDPSVALAATQEARALAPFGMFGIGDEMSLAAYAQREAIFSSFVWHDSDAKGTIIAAYQVNPLEMYRLADPVAGQPYRWATIPLSYVALLFAQWRGSQVFRLRPVKNAFFSGRLRLCYFPLDRTKRAVGTNISEEDLASVHSTVVDLSQHSETDYVVPYVNDVMWAQSIVQDIPSAGGDSSQSNNLRPLGYFYVVVQLPLTISATIATDRCEVVVSKMGGPDIEFGVLRPLGAPCYVETATDAYQRPPRVNLVAEARRIKQSGVLEDQRKVVAGPAPTKAPTVPLGPLCHSESWTSWRDVIHRFCMLAPAHDENTAIPICSLEMDPNGMLYYARLAFAYYTGSLRWALGNTATRFIPGTNFDMNAGAAAYNSAQPNAFWSAPNAQYPSVMVRLPWVEDRPFLPTGNGTLTANGIVQSTRSSSVNMGFATPPVSAVAGGDDMHFGYPVGTPPVCICNDNTQLQPDNRYIIRPFT